MRRPSSDRSLPLSVSAVLGAVLLSALPLQGGGFDTPQQVPSEVQARPQAQGRPLAMDDASSRPRTDGPTPTRATVAWRT